MPAEAGGMFEAIEDDDPPPHPQMTSTSSIPADRSTKEKMPAWRCRIDMCAPAPDEWEFEPVKYIRLRYYRRGDLISSITKLSRLRAWCSTKARQTPSPSRSKHELCVRRSVQEVG